MGILASNCSYTCGSRGELYPRGIITGIFLLVVRLADNRGVLVSGDSNGSYS